MVTVEFDTDHTAATTREQFEGDAACARKEIQCLGSLKVDILRQHIKDILLGEVRCRPRLETPWNIEVPSLISSCDDSHLPFTINVIKSYGIPFTFVAGAWLNSAVGLLT